MTLTIHRGTHEVGGSCVEIRTAATRLLIDIGARLPDADAARDDPPPFEPGDDPHPVDAILLSHAHLDHAGRLADLAPGTPVHLSAGTKRLLELEAFFRRTGPDPRESVVFSHRIPFHIGDLLITPFLVDHSGFDASAFLIEGEGRRLFYSGDFRLHGRKSRFVEELIARPPPAVDCLVLEGTRIDSPEGTRLRETDVETGLRGLFAQEKMAFVSYATTNIDRLVSLYKAAMAAGRILVIDPYTAFVLDALGGLARLPQPGWKRDFRIWFAPGWHTDTIAAARELARFAKHKISTEEVLAKRQRIVIRNTQATRTRFAATAISADTLLIYSLWRGWYKDTERAFWHERGIEPCFLHSGGHAGRTDLVRFAAAFPEAVIVPIHTDSPEAYRELFGERCRVLSDREAFEV